MSFNAKYIQRGDIIDYVPAANTAAGSVVFVGDVVGIAKLDIKAGELGALALTGVYEFAKTTGAVNAGDKVYWDSTNSRITKTANAYYLGIAVRDAASADTVVRVLVNAGATGYSG